MMARGTYRFVPRPAGVEHQHPYLVFDGQGRLHFHLTVLAKEATAQLSAGTVRTYLYAILPFFSFLNTDPWQQRAACRWDAAPEEVRQVVDETHCLMGKSDPDQRKCLMNNRFTPRDAQRDGSLK